jgi:large repetitive protein
MAIETIGTTGLSIDTITGVISGIPAVDAVGTLRLNVTATNSFGSDTNEMSLVINPVPAALAIANTTLPVPFNNQKHYVAQFYATGGIPPYTWEKVGGNGVAYALAFKPSLARISGSTGSLSDVTPVTFTMKVTDFVGTSVTKQFSLLRQTTSPAGTPVVTTTFNDLPQGTKDTPYAGYTLAATGSGAISWKIISGSLPAGLTFNPVTRLISGTPTVAGPSNFTLELINSVGTTHYDLQIGVYGPPLITTAPTAVIWRNG